MPLTEEQAALCRSWLKHYDWQLYGDRTKPKHIIRSIQNNLGFKPTYRELTPLLDECEALSKRNHKHRRKSLATPIDSKGWEKAIDGVKGYMNLAEKPGMTLAGFTRRLLYFGIPVNEHIVSECLALLKVSLPTSVEPWKRPQ